MKAIKKITCMALALMMVGSGVAGVLSATAEEAEGNVKKPVYETEFTIGAWVQFYDTNKTPYLEQVEELARCGMNLIDSPTARANSSGGNATAAMTGGKEFYQQLDALAQQIGMYYLLTDGDIFNFDYVYDMAAELENCIGYHLKDEPSAAQMDALAEYVRAYNEADPNRIPFVNLFPSYAGATNLGGTYRDYVTKWVNVVGAGNMDWLYFDHYPFTQTEDVRSTYFSDLEVIRDVAYKNGKIKTGGFTQMGSWNGMTRPTEDMARWSINSLLAYGLKSISHFCWVAPGYVAPENGGEGMRDFVTDSDGNPTDLYEPVSIMNWQTRQLGDILMNIDVKHAYHTGKTPVGAEGLPSSFLLQPGNASDSFVYSIAYSKDTDEPYLLVFNKALDGDAKEYSFNVDLNTGVQSLTYYKPTDYTADTMPDPYDLEGTLLPPEEISIDVASGGFTATFEPGEMKVFKLEGESVEIFEDLQVPESSHSSGVYTGPQRISLMTGDTGAKIYYTLDGSFPEPGKAGTYLYEKALELGSYGESKTYTVRAISVRGTDVSDVLDIDMMVMDASHNATGGVVGSFVSLDGTREVSFSGFNGSATSAKHLTDGSYDPNNSVLVTSEVGWAVVDMGKEETIDRVSFSFWHDWYFGDVKIQIACKEDFSDAVTVFETASMQNVPSVGSSVSFEPTKARYIRATNNCKGEGKYSLFTELQAHTYYRAEADLLADTASWSSLAQGNFTNDGSVIKESTPYQTANWDKAYSYDAKKFKNFMIDAKMSIDVSDPGAWGFVGIQIFRDGTDVVQSKTGKGLVVGIEPKGRALLWNGSKEVGALDANIAGWSVGSTFDLKLVVYEGTISVAIDGRPILTQYLPEYVGKSGYISIHSGLLPMTVTSFGITELNEGFGFATKGYAVQTTQDVKVAIEKYVAESEVLKQLGNTVNVIDTAGNVHSIGVTWAADGYDRTKTGNFDFVGVLDVADLEKANLSNVYGVKAYATVFVKSEIDRSVIENLIDVANGLNSYEYTEASWEYLQLKVSAAESILADPFLVQSDVNVGMFQLYDAIYKSLVYSGDVSELKAAIDLAKEYSASAYTEYSYADLETAIVNAESYLAQTFKTYDGVKAQLASLEDAQKALVKKTEVKPELELEAPELAPVEPDEEPDGSNVLQDVLDKLTEATSSCSSAIASVNAAIAALGAALVIFRKKH